MSIANMNGPIMDRQERKRWRTIHASIMAKLKLPCKLVFDKNLEAVGQHAFDDVDETQCELRIRTDIQFERPEHLILHEAAHHIMSCDAQGCFTMDACCFEGMITGHCIHWARRLKQMYKQTGYELPKSTCFPKFAKAAKIVLRQDGGRR